MDFSLTAKEKLVTYELTKKSFEKDLIQRLCAVGIDPDDFDSDSFVAEEDKMSHYYISELILKIKKVEKKILETQNIINPNGE